MQTRLPVQMPASITAPCIMCWHHIPIFGSRLVSPTDLLFIPGSLQHRIFSPTAVRDSWKLKSISDDHSQLTTLPKSPLILASELPAPLPHCPPLFTHPSVCYTVSYTSSLHTCVRPALLYRCRKSPSWDVCITSSLSSHRGCTHWKMCP